MCSCVRNCSISICSLQFYILYYTLPLYQRLHQSTLASAHCTLYSLSVRTFRIMYTLRINQLLFYFIHFFFFSSFENSCSVAFVLFIVLIGVSIVTLIIIIISYTQCIEHGDCGVYVHVMQFCSCIQQQQQQQQKIQSKNVEFHFTRFSIKCVYRFMFLYRQACVSTTEFTFYILLEHVEWMCVESTVDTQNNDQR